MKFWNKFLDMQNLLKKLYNDEEIMMLLCMAIKNVATNEKFLMMTLCWFFYFSKLVLDISTCTSQQKLLYTHFSSSTTHLLYTFNRLFNAPHPTSWQSTFMKITTLYLNNFQILTPPATSKSDKKPKLYANKISRQARSGDLKDVHLRTYYRNTACIQ